MSHLPSLANYFLNVNFGFTVNLVKEATCRATVKVFMERINEVLATTPYDELFVMN